MINIYISISLYPALSPRVPRTARPGGSAAQSASGGGRGWEEGGGGGGPGSVTGRGALCPRFPSLFWPFNGALISELCLGCSGWSEASPTHQRFALRY